tara:strand:+ start:177 stop:659 length:483 start_codon:yes stop_codon:yes gene_type:complete
MDKFSAQAAKLYEGLRKILDESTTNLSDVSLPDGIALQMNFMLVDKHSNAIRVPDGRVEADHDIESIWPLPSFIELQNNNTIITIASQRQQQLAHPRQVLFVCEAPNIIPQPVGVKVKRNAYRQAKEIIDKLTLLQEKAQTILTNERDDTDNNIPPHLTP